MGLIHRGYVTMESYKDVLEIILEGDDDVTVDTLTTVLDNTVKILKETAQYTIEDRYEKFVVKDVRKGSFIVDLLGVVSSSPGILINTATAITMFKNFLDIKKHLNGKDALSVKQTEYGVSIENNDGNVYIADKMTFNTYTTDSTIDDSLTNITRTIAFDPQRTALKINVESGLNGNSETLELTKEEAIGISKNVDLSKLNPSRVDDQVRIKVRIKSADFEGNAKWQCYVMGKMENVKINDIEFKRNLEGYMFTKGTILDVDMIISYSLDLDEKEIRNNKREFVITKVHNVLNDEKADQVELFDFD